MTTEQETARMPGLDRKRKSPAARRARAMARTRAVYRWHRRIGIVAALLVVVLSLTGWMLNHTESLGLADRHVSAAWLLDWYGVGPETEPVSFRAGEHWITWVDGHLYLNAKGRVAEDVARPIGAAATGDLVIAAAPEELLLFMPDGALVERMSETSLPGAVVAVGRDAEGRLAVRTPAGVHLADRGLLEWEAGGVSVEWSEPAETPEAVMAAVLEAYRGQGLPWERVILDLHSGRILGAWGPYLMDAAALALLVLAGTGLYNWLRVRRR